MAEYGRLPGVLPSFRRISWTIFGEVESAVEGVEESEGRKLQVWGIRARRYVVVNHFGFASPWGFLFDSFVALSLERVLHFLALTKGLDGEPLKS
jgi:hypothetical protein